jgi:outer membrane receptor protein involved in Fe transport
VAPGQRGAADHRAGSRHGNLRARAAWREGSRLALRVQGRLFDERLDAGTDETTASARVVAGGAGARLAAGGGELAVDLFAGAQRFGQRRARVAPDRSSAVLAAVQRVPSSNQGAAVTYTAPPLALAGEHVLLVGADLQRVRGTSRERLFPQEPGPAAVVARNAGGEQRFVGVFVQDAARLAPWLEATAALRVDRWWNLDGARTEVSGAGGASAVALPDRAATEVSPRAGLLVRAGRAVLRASAYRAFRAPTLNELHRPFQVGTVLTAPNEALRAETLRGVEAGPEVAAGPVMARVTAFWNVLDGPIQNVTLAAPLPGGATRQRRNLGRARIRGLEAELGWRPSRAVSAVATYTFVEPVVTAAPGQEALVGRDLPQDPRHRATASVSFDDRRVGTASLQVRAAGRQYEDDLNTLPMGAFAVVDVYVSREVGAGLSLFAAAENLLDRRYLVGRAGVDTVGQPLTVRAGVHLRR